MRIVVRGVVLNHRVYESEVICGARETKELSLIISMLKLERRGIPYLVREGKL